MITCLPVLLALSVLLCASAHAESASDLLSRSIAYHDPQGVWSTGRFELSLETVYSDMLAEERGIKESTASVSLAPSHGEFGCVLRRNGNEIEYRVLGEESTTLVNGSADISDEERERLRLADPKMYRDYFEYLWGMPMKLHDPGTVIDPVVKERQFDDRTALVIRVTYDPEVGSDVWDFFFDPESAALIGYRFFHDEGVVDGEHIVFSGEVVDPVSGLRLPSERAWYYNDGRGHLATDTLTELEVSGGE